MKRTRLESRRGFVLLLALGVLGVLGLLAATFATLSRVERSISSSYVDKVRAKMLAQSGIERALASIRGRSMIQAWDDQRNDWYYREMLNAEAGALSYPAAVKADTWKYIPTRAYGMPPRSLETALDDGLINGTPNGISFPQPATLTTNEPYSGEFPGTFERHGDIYALKVLDCASMINVNDGGKHTVRMLNNLGSILKCADGSLVSASGFKLGDQVATAAIARTKPFNSKAEVLEAVFLGNPWFSGDLADARRRFAAVSDFITCHGWVDGMTTRFENTWNGATDYIGGDWSSAISSLSGASGEGTRTASAPESPSLPGATDPLEDRFATAAERLDCASSPLFTITAEVPGMYASLPATRFLAAPVPALAKDVNKGGGYRQYVTGQGANAVLGGETAPGKFGGSNYFGEPRTPVNINTCSREVLVATLMNLEADFWDYLVVSESATPKVYRSNVGNVNVKLTQADAEKAADYIISSRFTNGSPAGAWSFNDWMHFEDDVLLAIPGLTRFQKALIKANANPNTNVKKLCPDLLLVCSNPSVQPENYVRMDKSDVKVSSTEWTFSSNGVFEMECIGRVYSGGKVMAEEKIEMVVKVFDQVVYTTQEQLEKDRVWTADDSKEGDLLAGGYPPVVSMPEYLYNALPNPSHYRSQTGDVSWCADYEGYLILNGPANVQAGQSPGPARDGSSSSGSGLVTQACWGNDPYNLAKVKPTLGVHSSSLVGDGPPTGLKLCAVSFVAGFNLASLYPNQSHRSVYHDGSQGGTGAPRHPEYMYQMPDCSSSASSITYMPQKPAHSFTQDVNYVSSYYSPLEPWQIKPTKSGADFWDMGCDLQNFGIYINELRRNRFHTYWGDEVPSPNCTLEMTVKPEIDLWTWATPSRSHKISGWTNYSVLPCKRKFFFDWGVGGTKGMNYTVRGYAELSRVYLEFYFHATGKFYVMWHDNTWKPHTWHHVQFSWVAAHEVTRANGTKVTVPPNAMLWVDGNTNSPGTSSMGSDAAGYPRDVNTQVGFQVYGGAAMVLPANVCPTNPNNDIFAGPRLDIGGVLAADGEYGMSQPRWLGVIDNIVLHHWRSHTASFTPRNRYHSMTYYDGSTWKSGEGYKKEKAGVYKKRLTYLESLAATKDITIGTVGGSHYHPFHVHLYGHDGSAPTTSFGHITPSLRIKTGGSFVDSYYYDGCVGVPVKSQLKAGSQAYFIGWFEVAALVPVTMSPILCDIRVTYFEEPQALYRLSSSEARK